MKTCSRCSRALPLSSFYKDPRYELGVIGMCIDCKNLWPYGITYLDYLDMLAAQDSRCVLCGSGGRHGHSRPLDVDHCHDTGKLRSLLCGGCNRGLGFFGDTVEGLQRAIDYLESHT